MAASASFGSGDRFYHNICPVTLKEGTVPCKQCGLIRYSSGEAAEAHWESHAQFCRILSKLTKATGFLPPGAAPQVAGVVKLLLRRCLTQQESDLLMFPRTCARCSVPCPGECVPCPACPVVFCNKECKEGDPLHEEDCKPLASNLEDYLHWCKNSKEKEVAVALDRLPHPLPWDQGSMSALLSAIDPNLALEKPLGRAISSILSAPLTTLLILPDPRTTTIEIHLVGARRLELASLAAWLTLPHAKIRLVMVGPECPDHVPTPSSPPGAPELELVFIPPCTYDKFALSPDYTEPDLVCAFNCGFILYNSWAASLPHMIRSSGAPLLFTEYYLQDCKANLDLLQEEAGEVEVLVAPTRNPWSAATWERAPPAWGDGRQRLGRAAVICDNQHVAVVKKKENVESEKNNK